MSIHTLPGFLAQLKAQTAEGNGQAQSPALKAAIPARRSEYSQHLHCAQSHHYKSNANFCSSIERLCLFLCKMELLIALLPKT